MKSLKIFAIAAFLGFSLSAKITAKQDQIDSYCDDDGWCYYEESSCTDDGWCYTTEYTCDEYGECFDYYYSSIHYYVDDKGRECWEDSYGHGCQDSYGNSEEWDNDGYYYNATIGTDGSEQYYYSYTEWALENYRADGTYEYTDSEGCYEYEGNGYGEAYCPDGWWEVWSYGDDWVSGYDSDNCTWNYTETTDSESCYNDGWWSEYVYDYENGYFYDAEGFDYYDMSYYYSSTESDYYYEDEDGYCYEDYYYSEYQYYSLDYGNRYYESYETEYSYESEDYYDYSEYEVYNDYNEGIYCSADDESDWECKNTSTTATTTGYIQGDAGELLDNFMYEIDEYYWECDYCYW